MIPKSLDIEWETKLNVIEILLGELYYRFEHVTVISFYFRNLFLKKSS